MAPETENTYIFETRQDSIDMTTANMGLTKELLEKKVSASDCGID